jgi:hypothetical protein
MAPWDQYGGVVARRDVFETSRRLQKVPDLCQVGAQVGHIGGVASVGLLGQAHLVGDRGATTGGGDSDVYAGRGQDAVRFHELLGPEPGGPLGSIFLGHFLAAVSTMSTEDTTTSCSERLPPRCTGGRAGGSPRRMRQRRGR